MNSHPLLLEWKGKMQKIFFQENVEANFVNGPINISSNLWECVNEIQFLLILLRIKCFVHNMSVLLSYKILRKIVKIVATSSTDLISNGFMLFRNFGPGQNYVPVQEASSSQSLTLSSAFIIFTRPFLMHR